MNIEERNKLIDALLEGDITEADFIRLEAEFLVDPEAREAYYARMKLSCLLTMGAEHISEEKKVVEVPRRSRWRVLAAVGYAAAACVVLGLGLNMLGLFGGNSDGNSTGNPIAEPWQKIAGIPHLELTDDGVAVLTRAVAVEWGRGTKPKIGDTIPPGVLRLESGLAQIEFFSGASMVLEGPAELELISADRCFFREGKLRVTAPRAAEGFTVLTPEIELVDLGTEFAVEVSPRKETKVHVFDGKVELYPPDAQRAPDKRTELKAGSGQHIESSGDSSAIATNPKAFVSMEDMKHRVGEVVKRRAQLWRQHRGNLSQDPRIIAYYTFEQGEGNDRILQSHQTLERSLDGAIVGSEWSEGRWPGKGALEFKRPGDRVRIRVPGEYDALTLAAWIRVDGLDRVLSSLLLTEGFDMGEIHWQIYNTGQLRLGIRTLPEPEEGMRSHNYDSSVIWSLKQIGQWIHVATVVDNKAGTVVHYANGRKLSSEPLKKPIKLRIGDAQIGNWGSPPTYMSLKYGEKIPIRNFNGRIDEFVIMDQALGDEEIEALYNEGKSF